MNPDTERRRRWEAVRDAMLFLRGLQEEGFPLDEGIGTLLRIAARELSTPPVAYPLDAFCPGDRVRHPDFGVGIVTKAYGEGAGRQVNATFPGHGQQYFISIHSHEVLERLSSR